MGLDKFNPNLILLILHKEGYCNSVNELINHFMLFIYWHYFSLHYYPFSPNYYLQSHPNWFPNFFCPTPIPRSSILQSKIPKTQI